MPNVGGKKFPYDAEGMAAAEAQAENTGQEVVMSDDAMQAEPQVEEQTGAIPSYDAGGRVQKIQGYGKGGRVQPPKGRLKRDDIEKGNFERYQEMKEKEWKDNMRKAPLPERKRPLKSIEKPSNKDILLSKRKRK